jgi:hypothetical protein
MLLVAAITALFAVPAASVTTERIAFTSARDGDEEIYTARPDRGALRKLTVNRVHDLWKWHQRTRCAV